MQKHKYAPKEESEAKDVGGFYEGKEPDQKSLRNRYPYPKKREERAYLRRGGAELVMQIDREELREEAESEHEEEIGDEDHIERGHR